MSEMKWTPGPWKIAYLDKHAQRVVKSQHFEICTCWHHSSIEQEMEANTRLIAAAPELYAALEDVPLPSTQGGWGEFIPRFYDWLNGSRDAALARARGEPL